jgi:hypothetical protein
MKGSLYRDIHYFQAPLSFYFLKALSWLSPEHSTYAVLRSASVITTAAALIVGGCLCLETNLARSMFFLLASSNFYLISGAFEIGSYSLPLLLLSASAALVARGHGHYGRIKIFAIGLLLGLAASTKLNYLFFLCFGALFVTLFWERRSQFHEKLIYLEYYCIGAIFGLAPLWLEFIWQPHAFWVHNVTFHSDWGNSARGLDIIGNLKSIWRQCKAWMTSGGAVLLALTGAVIIADGRHEANHRLLRLATFILLMTAASFLSAFAPGIGFKQYYIPVSFCVVLGSCLLIDASYRVRSRNVILLSGLVAASVASMQILQMYPRFQESQKKPAIWKEVEKINFAVAQELANFNKQKCQPEIFSFSGAFVIDTGFPLSKFTEGGIFWVRLDGFVEERFLLDSTRYHVPKSLLQPGTYIQTEGINIILLGYYNLEGYEREMEAEQKLRDLAIQAGYVKKSISTNLLRGANTSVGRQELELWIKPMCIGQ